MDEFLEKHGITFDEYKLNKRYKCESPARVVARMKSTEAARLEITPAPPKIPDKAVEEAAENIHALLSKQVKPETTKQQGERLVLDVPMTEITIKVPTSAVQNGITLRVNWTE